MSIQDDLLKHKIFLQRLTKKEIALYKATLEKAKQEIAQNKSEDVRMALQLLFGSHTLEVFARLQQLMNYETDLTINILEKWVDEDITQTEASSINDVSLGFATRGTRLPLKEAYKRFDTQTIDKMLQTERDTETDKDLMLAIGALTTGLIIAQYASLASTAVNTVSSDAHVDVFEDNSNLIESLVWDATLDDSTCEDCEDLNGQEFDIGGIEEYCPLHANCRCELIPVVQNG